MLPDNIKSIALKIITIRKFSHSASDSFAGLSQNSKAVMLY